MSFSNRNIPLTVYIAMPLVTVLYVLANVSYFTVMDTSEILNSPAVAIVSYFFSVYEPKPQANFQPNYTGFLTNFLRYSPLRRGLK